MDSRFIFIPLAALSVMQPAFATVYLTVEQAQTMMFPGASFTADFHTLTSAEASVIEKTSDTSVLNREIKVWKVSSCGWFIADQVVGKHEFIPLALGLDERGDVKNVEVLEYREAYGGAVMNAAWLAQFNGKNAGSALKLTKDIQNISGATLSSKHITDGIRRLLATHAVLYASR